VRIIYDHQIFGWQEYGGVSRYFVEIAKRLQASDEYEVEILSPLFVNQYLKNDPTLRVRGRYVHQLPKATQIIQVINAGLVRRMLHNNPPDIVHETYYLDRRLAPSRTKTVVTVYDMTHEKFPHFFHSLDKTSETKRVAVERADHVICISESTRSDLIELFDVNREKTSAIHLAASVVPSDNRDTPPITNGSYIAYVGLRSGYKNFEGLLRAFAASEFLKKNFAIVCFGGEPFTASDRAQVARLHISVDRVLHAQGEDHALLGVYRNAAALVYPSLYEGFGLPPLEAMSAGCPVVCSNTSSLPEVCGEAAEYFDPHVPESIAAAIERVVMSSSRRQDLAALGLAQSQKFSWDTCARETAAVYNRIASANGFTPAT
jgi:glycosyltransferase involved in cell wall biosynthesis